MQKILSPNMLKTFETCPKKYYFKYVKNISMPVDDEIFETGKNIHALASYYLGKENIDRMELTLNPKEKEIWGYLKGIKYFSYEYINSEYNLSFKLNKNFLGGRLDALVKDNNKYYILDYKTGSAPKNAKYDYQTMIYMLAVSTFYKTTNVTFIYIDLKNKTEVSIELDESLIEEYKNKLEETIKKIKINDFARKNSDCKCEYKIICY